MVFALGCAAEMSTRDTAVRDADEITDARLVDAVLTDTPDGTDATLDASVGDSARADAPDIDAFDASPGDTCPPPAPYVFNLADVFRPTVATPVRRTDIPIAPPTTFGRIDVEIDFLRGPWASPAPSSGGIHNVFWLHRGQRGGDWLDNNVLYFNITGTRAFRLASNLGIDRMTWSQNIDVSYRTLEGQRYHAHTSYDAAGRTRWFRVTQGSTVVAMGSDMPAVASIASTSPYPRGQSMFFVEIGFVAWDGSGGPEVPSYGWEYSNLVVRFYPLSRCP